jgi:2-keto-4-pentenoate hydratase/2-oxohepta-3-ene-1,7-dioic acid hydratase in catechol pathway
MRLAALYGRDGVSSSLHLEIGDEYVCVDALAAALGKPQLRGIADVGELFRRGEQVVSELRSIDASAAPGIDRAAARLAPPVRRPGKIVCVGLNYLAHIDQSKLSRPDHIVLFSKFASCLVATGEPIIAPSITSKLDYEGELAVVVGKSARCVKAADAVDHVGGYTIINDISARDLQLAEPQWMRGKALDTFAPLGPVVIDAISAPPIDAMHIRTYVNGEIRQDAPCSLMITGVPELIEYVSAWITLEPGDIIATGTPSGVAAEMDSPIFMTDGDLVEVDITGIGRLRNPVVAPPKPTSLARMTGASFHWAEQDLFSATDPW